MSSKSEYIAGVIGTGRSGARFVEAQLTSGHPVVLFDTNTAVAQRVVDTYTPLATKNGVTIRATDCMEEVIDKGSSIIVATPDHLHTQVTLSALRRGRPVLSEKPFTTSVTDAKAIHDAVKTNSGLLVVNNNYRLTPAFGTIRDHIKEGALGEVLSVHTTYVHSMASVNDEDPWRTEGQTNDGTGQNFVWGAGSHAVDQAIWTNDQDHVVAVRASAASRKVNLTYRRPEDYAIELHHASGILSRVWLNAAVSIPPHGTTVEVYGTKGGRRAHNKRPYVEAYTTGDPDWRKIETENIPTVPRVVELFNAYAQTGKSPDPLPEIDEAMKLVYVLGAINNSIERGGDLVTTYK